MSEQQDVITIKIGSRTRHVKVPRSWDDLDDRTALLFYGTLFHGMGDGMTQGTFTTVKLIGMTQHLLGLDMDVMAAWERSLTPSPSPVERGDAGDQVFLEELKQVLKVALAGLFEITQDEKTGATGYAVKYNRTRNVWPALTRTPKGNGKTKKTTWYYCAADGLANITIYELAHTFSLYEAFAHTGDEALADKLIGTLYRPSRPETVQERESAWHGDRRQPLRGYEGKVEERAKMAKTLPALTRRFLVFWFAGCREAIVKQYPRVFRREGDGDRGAGGSNWGKLLLSLAETGTFGPLGETSDQHYSNALTYMTMKDEEAERMRREMEKTKKK